MESTRCGWFRSCITTARRSPRASSLPPSATIRINCRYPRSARLSHDLYCKAEIPASGPAEERSRLYPPGLRGQDLDAVRRLRPRLDHRIDHRGLLRTVDRAAPVSYTHLRAHE